ncbi:hypothetical protein [uncultured Pseudokineococcus sp.]|uniref:hypothetical protein n=1 Tax=uncultured Pseudokineococcus sp. TaxID=1642928 RepID=UPI0026252E9C|nr:hypothetical protein [uncultured Pseudokineococcus sp.]
MRRPTAPRPGAPLVALALVLVGALLGAVVGGVLGATRPTSRTATVLLALQPDSSVSANADATLDPAADVSDAFLQTELVYLGSDRFTSAVEAASGGEDVDLEATRVQQSNVVQLSATAGSPDTALAAAEAASSSYVDRRTQQAADRLDAQAQAVQSELEVVLQQIASASDGAVLPPNGGQVTALQGRYESLLTLASSVALARQSADQGATVIQPPVLVEPDGVPAGVLGAVLGGLLGALVGAGAAVLWRRRSTTVQDASDLAGVGGVLAPRLPRSSGGDLGVGAASPLAGAAARQSAQLVAGRGDAAFVLAVVGAGDGAGTSTVAAHHAAALARRAPVLLVCAADAVAADGATSAGAHLPGVDRGAAGLLDLRAGGRAPVAPEEVLAVAQRTGVEDLLVVTAGTGGGSASDLEHLVDRGLVAALRATGHDVVLDVPPLERSGAASRLASQVDAVALVVGLGSTAREDVAVGVRALERDGRAPAVVLTDPGPRRRSARRGGTTVDAPADRARGRAPAPGADGRDQPSEQERPTLGADLGLRDGADDRARAASGGER